MKTQNMKKYVIHILAVTALNNDILDLSLEQCAFILCTNRTNNFIDTVIQKNKLVLDFVDTEEKDAIGGFTGVHARAVLKFLEYLSDDVTDLYVCCSKGGSRSAGCAAALLLMSGRSDDVVWENPFYTPNTLVYQTLCKEYGIDMPDSMVKERVEMNNESFKRAQEANGVCEYERWQIIE